MGHISNFFIINDMHHICPIIRNEKVMRKRKQWVKNQNKTLFCHAASLTHSLQFGGFKAAHVPTDTGWWARILAASSWELKRKTHPVSGYTHAHSGHLYHSIGCLSLTVSVFFVHLPVSSPHLHYLVVSFVLYIKFKSLRCMLLISSSCIDVPCIWKPECWKENSVVFE